MKDILRRTQILQDEIAESLNRQVQMEAQASNAYLAMAAWCDKEGYDNSAKFFYEQSSEEREHQMKLFQYLLDMESMAYAPAVSQPNHEFVDLRSVFETALEHEITVTDSIHNIVIQCRKSGDIATEEFMNWFVAEQREEELVARKAFGLFELLGEDKFGLAQFEDKVLGLRG